jgi:hypothetical protein
MRYFEHAEFSGSPEIEDKSRNGKSLETGLKSGPMLLLRMAKFIHRESAH